jgi:hypothetical protein
MICEQFPNVNFLSRTGDRGGAEKYFERPPTRMVKAIGLVCAKSRRAGQFSCFLIGITGGSLFGLRGWRRFLASIG